MSVMEHRHRNSRLRNSEAARVHFVHSSLIFLKDTFEAEGANAMNFQMATLQPAAKTPSDAEGPDLPTDALSSAEMDVEIAPLVLKVGASSIAEFEKLLSELQEAKNFLQSEGERVQRETAQYINLARAASASFGFGARMARSRPSP